MNKQTPTEAIMIQIATIQEAINELQEAINETVGSVDPDNATWADVSKLAWFVDAVKRADLRQFAVEREG